VSKGFPTLKIYVETEIKDKHGKIIKKQRFRSRSLLTNFIRWMESLFECYSGWFGFTSVVDRAGTGHDIPDDVARYAYDFGTIIAGADNDLFGVLVGSGTTAVSAGDYNLASPISHGTGAGQLQYQFMKLPEITVVGAETRMRIRRQFINGSGVDVSVNEVRMALQAVSLAAVIIRFLIARDVLPTTDVVPDGATYTVDYIIRVTA